MKKVIFIVLFAAIIIFAHDDMWIKVYSIVEDWSWGCEVVPVDDGYLVFGEIVSHPLNKLYIVKVDEDGNTMWTRFYPSEYFGVGNYFDVVKTDDNNIVGFSGLLLFKVNEDGDSLLMKHYDSIGGFDIIKSNDGGFILAGLSPTCLGTLVVARTDSLGNIETIRNFENYTMPWGTDVLNLHICNLPPDEFLLADGALLYKFNYDLDTIWTRHYDYWFTSVDVITPLHNGNLILSGCSIGVLEISSSTGEILHDEIFSYDDLYIHWVDCLLENFNNNLILHASISDSSPRTDTRVVCVDSLWNILWFQKLYDASDSINTFFPRRILQLPDSSYLALGTATVPGDSYQVCLAKFRHQDTTDIIEEKTITPDNIDISVSPNPFNSSCAITVPAGAKLEIYDLKGNIIATPYPDKSGFVPLDKGDSPAPAGQGVYIWHPDASIPSGIYLIKAKMKDGRTATKRIVLIE